ncbi:MAG: tRNA lysidine(34) synthetase TilS [Candidatus Cryptobacteroides sp.]
MQKRFAQTINEMRGLVNDEGWSAPSLVAGGAPRFLAAVSGGVDSMVMADLFLKTLGPEGFAVAHCNFHLRGQESDGDEASVRLWAEEKGVTFHKVDFDTEDYARRNGMSIEMAARQLRYSWFARLCIDNGYVATAVAHNANDNAETLMLNLLRGTGLDGLSGMAPVSDFPVEECSCKVRLIRPLLGFTRKQIEGYALAWGIRYRDDSTNFLSDYKRNRLRNEVFPHFARLNPSFVRTLNKDMEYFAQAGDIVRLWCEEAASSVVSSINDALGEGVRIDVLSLMSHSHWKYLLYHILKPYGFNSSVLSSIEDLLASQRTVPGKRFESDSHLLLTGRMELSVYPKTSAQTAGSGDSDAIMTVRSDGTYHFNGRSFKVETITWTKDMALKQPDGVLVLDAAKMRFPFVLRRWRSGDWMVPLGMKGRKLLSDMFTDLKYDAASKSAAVVAVDVQTPGLAESQHVAALVCKRMDEGCKITSSTRSAIRISEI